MSQGIELVPDRDLSAPTIRAIFRQGCGLVHLHWPPERIAEAVADEQGTLWVDIQGVDGDTPQVEALLRDVFKFHPLAIEDALKEANVPKVDDWDRYLYLVFHAIDFDPETDDLRLHELDAFLARNFLVTYHTEPMEIIERVYRLVERDAADRLSHRADHLLYQLLDHGVDAHIAAIEHLDEAIDAAQDEIFERPTPRTLQKIFEVKRAVNRLHRVVAPQREVANRLARDLYPQIGEKDRVYFRDVYDGLVRLHDITENLRDLITAALDTYLSVSANRTNDVMKTLTIVTVLFLPLNFLVGFFGMNFFGDNIELHGPHLPHLAIFLGSCALMLASPVGLWIWGRRRGWF